MFKLVPFGKFVDTPNTYSDADNPIGISGGGSFYSFTTRSHSFRKISQLHYRTRDKGEFHINFSSAGYGFIVDLGPRSLDGIDGTSPESQFFLMYKPPRRYDEHFNEFPKLKQVNIAGAKVDLYSRINVGHTYILRSIRYGEADVVVTLQVLERSDDGSVTVLWKMLGEFVTPPVVSDVELQRTLDEVVTELRIRDFQLTARESKVVVIGPVSHESIGRIRDALSKRAIRYLGFDFSKRQLVP